MLGRRGRSREPPSGWERFCRDQAREKAADFFQQVRAYRSRDPTVAVIPESQLASRFAAYLQDELTLLGLGEGYADVVVTSEERSAMNGSATYHAQVQVQPQPARQSTASSGSAKGKSWWNMLKHKWTNKAGGRKTSTSGSDANAAATSSSVVLEGSVSLLDMNDPSQDLLWQLCKLVLLYEQGSYQLKVYSPPKVHVRTYTKVVIDIHIKAVAEIQYALGCLLRPS